MGWNQLRFRAAHPVFAGIAPGAHAYFVHSYGFNCADPTHVLATVDYGGPVTAAMRRATISSARSSTRKRARKRDCGSSPISCAGGHDPLSGHRPQKAANACASVRGDMDQATVFNSDPAAQAREFVAAGAQWLHVVDLDGAIAGVRRQTMLRSCHSWRRVRSRFNSAAAFAIVYGDCTLA